MKITTLLIASTAALASVTVAQAADAIVAAEPEPLEYVRVCDAFGTGYFYIPGTETCLKVGGYVRFQVDARSDLDGTEADESGYRTRTRGKLGIDAKSDTEFGTLSSTINMEAQSDDEDGGDFYLDETFIELGGLRVGYFYNYFDTGLPGETVLTDNGPSQTLNNSIRYTYDGGAFSVYGQVDFFEASDGWKDGRNIGTIDAPDFADSDEIGINGVITGKFGAAAIDLFAGYDFDTEEAAFASTLTAEFGAGSLGIFAAYATGLNRYWATSEWTIGAEYAFAVNDKFKIAPGVQYWDNVDYVDGDFDGGDAWRAGLTVDYAITTNLTTKATVNYTDYDGDDQWDGFLRLQRSF